MPRQPFLPNFSHLDYAVGALVLNDRPELTSAIGRCIAIWAQVDNEIGNLFGLLLGANNDATLEVFLTLRRSANQTEALRTAAKSKLTGADLRFSQALLQVYGAMERERNALAHGCFGVAGNDPGVLLWIDVRHHVHFQLDVLAKLQRGDAVPDPHKKLKEHMYVYKLSDLGAIQSDMEQVWEATRQFNSYLRNPTGSEQRTQFAHVQTLPLLASAISQLSKAESGA